MDIDARYEFLDKIGEGSYATVYRARDNELGREVAIKQIHDDYLADPAKLSRYWDEAQLLASLQHPNIVTIFDLYRERGWLILELMQSSVAERTAGRPMHLPALRTTVAHCLRALKYLHSRGVVHGDIKPGNLMIDARRRVKIGDFSLARRVTDDEGVIFRGTTKYLAPEVVSDDFGEVGPASDLYSLGFSAYELMCGENFDSLFPGLSAFGDNPKLAWMQWHAAPDRKLPQISRTLEGVPEDLSRVVEGLCEKNPQQRYKKADEALSDLKIDVKLVNQGGGDSEEAAPVDDAARKKKLMIAGGALAASLILCLVLMFLPGGSGGGDKQKVVAWIVKHVDADGRRIKVEALDRSRAEEIEIPNGSRISLEERGVSENVVLRDLKADDRIELEYVDQDGKRVMVIKAARPVVDRGQVRDVDLQNGSIEIAVVAGMRREVMKLRIPKNQKAYANLSRGKLDAVTEKRERERLLRNHEIQIGGVRPDDQVEIWHLSEVGGKSGRVIAGPIFVQRVRNGVGGQIVTVGNGFLEIRVGRGSAVSKLNLPLASDAKITLRGAGGPKTIDSADLKQGDVVDYEYDTEFRKLVVSRGQKQAVGSVRELAGAGKQVTVSLDETGARLTFAVAPGARVQLGLEAIAAGDLRLTDRVTVFYTMKEDGSLVAETINAEREPRADRWALVVGVQSFDDKSLARLPLSLSNARTVRDALKNRYAFQSERLVFLSDPTRAQIESELKDILSKARRGSQVIVYLSTHGFVFDGRTYLAGRKFDSSKPTETGLSLDGVVKLLESCPANGKLLLLDASHDWSGTRKPLPQPSTAEMLATLAAAPESTVAIASCSNGQHGEVRRDRRTGLFAYEVARGFGGAAETTPGNELEGLTITPDELFAYLTRSMAAASLGAGRTQTPARVPK